eukprot:TRINITY_DN17565_c0_g1_i1.p1 TRINITY_DN17565_c0_g1~~TRINITY_DN17565_c0_g1_i1.p1  ORF type:complete len:221 (-),score=21.02 TRINITY_DN17565_c0_g1_i1:77-715(-)
MDEYHSYLYTPEQGELLQRFITTEDKLNISKELRSIIVNISKTGLTCYPWEQLKILLQSTLSTILEGFKNKLLTEKVKSGIALDQEKFQRKKEQLLQLIDSFEGPPFTLQRFCELLVDPYTLYSSLDTYIFALEKMLSVSALIKTLDPSEYNRQLPIQTAAFIAATKITKLSPISTEQLNAMNEINSDTFSNGTEFATRIPGSEGSDRMDTS